MAMNPKKLVRKVLPGRGIRVAEEAYRKSRIYALQARYGFPAKGLRVIGVTGTNGKTTTCNYINEMLKSAGYTTAMFTTAVIEMSGERTENTIHRTVPLTGELLDFFRSAKAKKVGFVVLEVTSHALHQHKLVGVPIEVAVMTNLTQDHLDYHHSMYAYAAAKARLFGKYCNPKHVILNRDDEWYGAFKKVAVGKVTSYGQDKRSSAQMNKIILSPKGSEVALLHKGITLKVRTPMLGKFNAYNATAAACVGLVIGLTPKQIEAGVAALLAVPGRMEKIDEGQGFDVVVDYAHTPDALNNVASTLKEVAKGRLLLVFGATGDRDKSKRPIMGQIAAEQADRIFLTDDETYTEDPDMIRQAVMDGIEAAGGAKNTTVIADRKEAIKAAFKEAKKGDVVLLAGIGHQDYRAMGGKSIPWDERKVAREILRSKR
jgi:UDP-N-acetylmuramoyl-L-alanyl-D-glutamate--2,6-diaminopimelate ligase